MAETNIYILKVALEYDRDIWRRIAIRGDQTLGHLHRAIYRAFDREEDHLYAFYFGRSSRTVIPFMRVNALHIVVRACSKTPDSVVFVLVLVLVLVIEK